METADRLDIVGALEIVYRAFNDYGVAFKPDTVKAWERRRREWVRAGRPTRRAGQECIPEPVGLVNGQPAWSWSGQVVPWMRATGKIKDVADQPHADC